MARISKAFVWLLTAYIITVIILITILRDNSQRLESSALNRAELLRNLAKQNAAIEQHHQQQHQNVAVKDSVSSTSSTTETTPKYNGDSNHDNDETDNYLDTEDTEDDEDVDGPRDDDTYIRYGPGENGTAVNLTEDVLRTLNTSEFQFRRKFHGFNTYVSDIVNLERKVQDTRPEACKTIRYPSDMAPASVVIIFRDEWPSVVLRTAYSVMGRSPAHLLKEVVLVDDGSKDLELKAIIDIHVSNVEKFKLVRNPSPLGLMLARQKGIEATTSEYFVVMDGHMEVGPGWLEPLVARLQEVPKALLCSHVGGVDQETFEFRVGKVFDGQFPFFDPLTLNQMWASYSSSYKIKRNGSVEAMPMGTVQGMMAVMRKDFFMQLGGFDPGMKQWGSEQMELSIKVWMCGGRVEMLPCSKVAHMYRVTPWGKVNKTSDFLVANSIRTAEVWLDDPYKTIVRDTIGRHSEYEIGDLSDRHRIRRENDCKPFQYFIDTVKTFSDVYLIGDIKANGYVRNKQLDLCLSMNRQKDKSYKLGTNPCSSDTKHYFILTEHGQIRSMQGTTLRTKIEPKNNTTATIDVVKSTAYVYMRNAVWEYMEDGSIYNTGAKFCLTVGDKNVPLTAECNGDLIQEWAWEPVKHE